MIEQISQDSSRQILPFKAWPRWKKLQDAAGTPGAMFLIPMGKNKDGSWKPSLARSSAAAAVGSLAICKDWWSLELKMMPGCARFGENVCAAEG